MKINVVDFGAVGDGITINTSSIQKAIDQCHEVGGGTVLLCDGRYVSGTLYLKSNVFLEIDVSAALLASPYIHDYGRDTHYNRYRNETELDPCFIYGEDATNIGIIGYGEINGNAQAFPNTGSIYRPMLIRLLRCSHIHLSTLRLYNAAAWTTAFLDSKYIWINDLDICNEKNYNGDGLDFDGCSHVFVSSCRIKGTDDNLCIQSSDKNYLVRDIHITNCEFTSLCAAIRIGLKSIGSISNVVIANCTMNEVYREGIKIECTEGGNISDISISQISMRNVRRPIFVILNNRFEPDDLGSSISLKEMPQIGSMKGIFISGIIARDNEEMGKVHLRFDNDIMGSPRFNGIRFDAEENHPIEEVVLSHIYYTTYGGVTLSEIPDEYPKVLDRKMDQDKRGSENYYPDWSRALHMDLRNINHLSVEGLHFDTLHKDERQPVIIEGCTKAE